MITHEYRMSRRQHSRNRRQLLPGQYGEYPVITHEYRMSRRQHSRSRRQLLPGQYGEYPVITHEYRMSRRQHSRNHRQLIPGQSNVYLISLASPTPQGLDQVVSDPFRCRRRGCPDPCVIPIPCSTPLSDSRILKYFSGDAEISRM